MLFLFYVSVDTSVIVIVSKCQEKIMTVEDLIAIFVRKYTFICAYICLYLPMWIVIIGESSILVMMTVAKRNE